MRRIAVVAGPTASGKTALAIALAKELGGEIVSADSMQIYRGCDIGTAKPTADEMQGIAHHMLDVADPREQYSVSRYEREASACIDGIFSRGALPIVCGGTGLYIDALIRGGGFAEKTDPGLRSALEMRYEREGGAVLLRELEERDPETARKLHENDKKRIVRALEVLESTGRTISQHNEETQRAPARFDAATIILNIEPRQALYERIHRRVDLMMEQGLLQEARGLYERGALAGTAAQAIGYKELFGYFAGRESLNDAIETIKRKSCNYAKRQLTWFRRSEHAKMISHDGTENARVLLEATNFLREYGLK